MLLVVTVRMNSDRRNGKVMAEINGSPLLYWILKRLDPLYGKVVVAITTNACDDVIEQFAISNGYPVVRHQQGDLVGTVAKAMELYPNEEFVQRILGDCPFIEIPLVARAREVLQITSADAFLWHQAPHIWPVYGAREFPYRRSVWDEIIKNAKNDELEHPDLYFNRHREDFKIVYHAPPPDVYYRNAQWMRLEVDYEADLVMVTEVARSLGMLAPLRDVVQFLDKRDRVRNINAQMIEKTGPAISYGYTTLRTWSALMAKESFYTWDNQWVKPLNKKEATPVYCICGVKLGDSYNGCLYPVATQAWGMGAMACPMCGTYKVWRLAR